ncbi:Tubulin delta chain [Holothuria leucospilota]|uniref:Tubulin delta chain n=1 Tax=Holothuria leucospilota TaxID=206669 RepID=A0A9Q1BCC6_HOLLE|nr:Tubulin delta chain [Holothuria leucospilota]
MSVVPVFVGQCGNQIGNTLYEVLERVKEPLKTWVDHTGKRRAVLIDSEPKVLKYLSTKRSKSQSLESNFVKSRQGCGSNWALGINTKKFV